MPGEWGQEVRGRQGGKGRGGGGGKDFQHVHVSWRCVFLDICLLRRPTERQKGNDIIFPCIIVVFCSGLHAASQCFSRRRCFLLFFRTFVGLLGDNKMTGSSSLTKALLVRRNDKLRIHVWSEEIRHNSFNSPLGCGANTTV